MTVASVIQYAQLDVSLSYFIVLCGLFGSNVCFAHYAMKEFCRLFTEYKICFEFLYKFNLNQCLSR